MKLSTVLILKNGLKLKFEKTDCGIAFQVLEQPEATIERGAGTLFRASNGYSIASVSIPQLSSNVLYLRGSSKSRDNIANETTVTNGNRAPLLDKVKAALAEWEANDFKKQ